MRQISVIIVSALLLASLALPSGAQTSPPPPGVVLANVVTAKVTVTAIDYQKRTATLRSDSGRLRTVKVPDSVVNFPQVQKGDKVTVTYAVATAIFLRKPADQGAGGAAPMVTQTEDVQVAPKGGKPGRAESQVTEITATVQAIDYKKRRVTLKGPLGNLRTIDVGDEVQNIEAIKKGDQVVVRHTEAVAISVTK